MQILFLDKLQIKRKGKVSLGQYYFGLIIKHGISDLVVVTIDINACEVYVDRYICFSEQTIY